MFPIARKPSAVTGITQMLASDEPLLPVYALILLRTLISTERGRTAVLQSGIVEPLLEQAAVSEHSRCGICWAHKTHTHTRTLMPRTPPQLRLHRRAAGGAAIRAAALLAARGRH